MTDGSRGSRGSVRPPPASIDELVSRAQALEGQTLDSIADSLGENRIDHGAAAKGKPGELLERVLGGGGGPRMERDFPTIGVELKSVPIGDSGRVLESTYVCKIQLTDADRAEWSSSWIRAKLTCVLWVPLWHFGGHLGNSHDAEVLVGRAVLWRPSRDEEALLQNDFDDLMGTIGAGGIESISAHMGQVLQIRPKAASGKERTVAYLADGEPVATVPRGFYLRTAFTKQILAASLAASPKRRDNSLKERR